MSASLPAVVAALEAGLREGIAPALSAVVLRGGRTVHASVHGEVPGPAPRPLREDDLFDVASLTKVMATTTIAAGLVEEGSLALDAPVAARLPGFGPGKGAVTARHLLAHSSGLPAWRPYFEAARADPEAAVVFLPDARRPPAAALRDAVLRARALVRDAVLREPLEAAPGTRALYCDPGFMALGFLLEAIAGEPLATLSERRVFAPLRLGSTFFLDGADPAGAAARAAGRTFVPTGASVARGGEISQGAVNDDNAWALGGVGGHAGVFSTAAEVAALGQAWLDALDGRASPILAAVAGAFARKDGTPGSERALGWDTPTRGASSIGSRLGRGPRGALGHLGYTGTSLWIDLDAGLVCALLTNHVHPGGVSDRPRIRAFRQRFHDAVAEALGVG